MPRSAFADATPDHDCRPRRHDIDGLAIHFADDWCGEHDYKEHDAGDIAAQAASARVRAD